jgi:hypothetical protein
MRELKIDKDVEFIVHAIDRILHMNSADALISVDTSVYKDKKVILSVYVKNAEGNAISMGTERYLYYADEEALDMLCNNIESAIVDYKENNMKYLEEREQKLTNELKALRRKMRNEKA